MLAGIYFLLLIVAGYAIFGNNSKSTNPVDNFFKGSEYDNDWHDTLNN